MEKKSPLFFIFGVSIFVGILHFIGTYMYLYWRVDNYDRIVHISGGFLVTAICLSLIYFKRMPNVQKNHIVLVGLFSAFVIGFFWEIFELVSHITAFTDDYYWWNNGGDIIADIIGGALAVWYFIRTYSKKYIS